MVSRVALLELELVQSRREFAAQQQREVAREVAQQQRDREFVQKQRFLGLDTEHNRRHRDNSEVACFINFFTQENMEWRLTQSEIQNASQLAMAQGLDIASFDDVLLKFMFAKGMNKDGRNRLFSFREFLDDPKKRSALERIVCGSEKKLELQNKLQIYLASNRHWNDQHCYISWLHDPALSKQEFVSRVQLDGTCFIHAPIMMAHILRAAHCPGALPPPNHTVLALCNHLGDRDATVVKASLAGLKSLFDFRGGVRIEQYATAIQSRGFDGVIENLLSHQDKDIASAALSLQDYFRKRKTANHAFADGFRDLCCRRRRLLPSPPPTKPVMVDQLAMMRKHFSGSILWNSINQQGGLSVDVLKMILLPGSEIETVPVRSLSFSALKEYLKLYGVLLVPAFKVYSEFLDFGITYHKQHVPQESDFRGLHAMIATGCRKDEHTGELVIFLQNWWEGKMFVEVSLTYLELACDHIGVLYLVKTAQTCIPPIYDTGVGSKECLDFTAQSMPYSKRRRIN